MAITDDNARLQSKVDDWVAHYEWLWRSRTNWLNQIERYWRRWHSDPSLVRHLRDPWLRQQQGLAPLKRWQTVLVTPRGAINEAARSQAMANLISETRPMLSVRGLQADDLQGERPIESLMDYQLGILNPAIEWITETFTRAFVQGCAPLEFRWKSEFYYMDLLPRKADERYWTQAMRQALRVIDEERARGDASAVDAPGILPDGSMDPEAFAPQNWRATVQALRRWAAYVGEKYGIQVPDPPHGDRVRVAQHVGIRVGHLELADLVWDFREPRFREVPRVYKRMVMDKDEALRGCKEQNARATSAGLRAPFDLAAIEDLQPGIVAFGTEYDSVQGLQDWILNDVYGVQTHEDPSMRNAIEIIEVWEPRGTDGYRWCWIGQRNQALTRTIGKGPDGRMHAYYPFNFPEHPFACHFHIPTPGLSMGKSSFDYEGPRHDFLDELESLYADMFKLTAGSPLQRIGGFGIEGRAEIDPAPFSVIANAADEIGVEYRPLYGDAFSKALAAAGAAIQYHKNEIDISQAVDDVSRGQSATINRVGVGEVQMRAQNQQTRPKHEMYRFGAMICRDVAPLIAGQALQFGEPEDVDNITGVKDSLALLTTATLRPALQANYLTMPAAVMAEVALAIQQLQETLKTGAEIGVIVPGKQAARALFRELLRLQRIPAAAEFIAASEADLQQLEQEQGQVQQASQAAQQAQQAAQQAAEQVKVLAAENTALRRFLRLPSYETVDAMMEALTAGAPAPQLEAGEVPGSEPAGGQPQQIPPPESALDGAAPAEVA